MGLEIIRFDTQNISMLPRKQQPFEIFGKLIPAYDGEKWNITEQILDKPYEKTYPDDSFDPAEYINNPEQAAYLAISGGECVGSIRVCKRWNGDAFIDDLAIDRAFRRQGVGARLMDAAFGWARENGLKRVSLETQNDNLAACRFYIKYGFNLGGIDASVYTRPEYKGETALYFYKEGK